MGIFKRSVFVSVLALATLGASCNNNVRDAKVGTLYTGPNQDVVKKLGDPDGSVYSQINPQSGNPAMSPGFVVLSAIDFNLLTYAATRVLARDALGGGDVSRVRVYREIAAAPSEMVADFRVGPSSNPALAVLGNELYVVWVGGPGLNEVGMKSSSNGTNWTDLPSFNLPATLTGIDAAAFGDNMLLAGFEDNTAVVYELNMAASPPSVAGRFTIGSVANAQMTTLGQVSLAVKNDGTVLVLYARQADVAAGDPCNADLECRSNQCINGLCVGMDPASGAHPGSLSLGGLSLAAGTRGQTSSLWYSGPQPVVQWASGARIVQSIDGPAPNDYVLAAFRGLDGTQPEVFICKWEWPTGTAPNWALTPSDCPTFIRLNDSYLDVNRVQFDIYADEFVRQEN